MHWHRRRRRKTQPGRPLHVHWHLSRVLLLCWVVLMRVLLLTSVLLRWMLWHRPSLCRRWWHTLHLRLLLRRRHRRRRRHSRRLSSPSPLTLLRLLLLPTSSIPKHFYIRDILTRHSPALPPRARIAKQDIVELDIRSSINIAHAALDDGVGRLLECDYHCCAYEVRHIAWDGDREVGR